MFFGQKWEKGFFGGLGKFVEGVRGGEVLGELGGGGIEQGSVSF